MRNWEQIFSGWAAGPSKTEEKRISNSITQIRSAIDGHDGLKARDINVFVQGSYRNRVNVKSDSDIDIGIVCNDTFFPDYPNDENVKNQLKEDFSDSTYNYSTYKNEIEEALVSKFGRTSVERGNKAFDIKANSYRVEADVAAFFEHRRYSSRYNFISGVELRPDNGMLDRVINWPEQHYQNGVSKNSNTNKRYKRTVRILKKLTNEMSENKVPGADGIPGFLIECLCWNVPDNILVGYDSNFERIKHVLIYLYESTKGNNGCTEWGEVSELKYLFRGKQVWNMEEVNNYTVQSWNYIGY